MPTVLRVGGFRVAIHLPPREHGPPYVHVWNASGRVAINLGDDEALPEVRGVIGMRAVDLATALRIVDENWRFLHERWRPLHG